MIEMKVQTIITFFRISYKINTTKNKVYFPYKIKKTPVNRVIQGRGV